jgi:hypothetical protein
MRRALALLIVAMLFVVGSSTAIAATTQKVTIRALVAQAGWETFDEQSGAGEAGSAEFATAEGRTTVTLSMSKGELVLCQGGDTPDDPFDDVFGFVGTSTFGEGPARLSLGKTYSSAKGSGTVTAEVFTFSECTGDEGTTSTKSIKVSIDLTGISPIIHETVRSTISIPSRLRSKTMIRADSREAAGSVKVGSRTIRTGGLIGMLSMKASSTTR